MNDSSQSPDRGIRLSSARGLAEWIQFQQAYCAIFRLNEKVLSKEKLSLPQLHLLAMLSYEGRPLSMTEISRVLVREPHTVTNLVLGASTRGWVRSFPHVRDARKKMVVLTEAGVQKLRATFPITSELGVELFKALSDDELALWGGLTRRIRDRALAELGVSLENL